MEEDMMKSLYQEYLKIVLEKKQIDKVYSDYEIVDVYTVKDPFVIKKITDNITQIVNSESGEIIAVFHDKTVRHVRNAPGLFWVTKKNGKTYSCDIYGEKVNLIYNHQVEDSFVYGCSKKRITGETKQYFFNDVTYKYEPLIYEPLTFVYSFDYGPHGDYTRYDTLPFQSKDYILFKDRENRVYLYRKATSSYQELKYDNQGLLDISYNLDKNLIKINNTFFYVNTYDVVDVTCLFPEEEKDEDEDIMYQTIEQIPTQLLTYEEFRSHIVKDKDFLKLIQEQVKVMKQKKYQKQLEDTKRIKEEEQQLKVLQRKKELLKNIFESIKELKELNINSEKNSEKDKLKIELDILFINVGNHKEINPIFAEFLSLIDLSLISFKNVKVSGINFSNTNANINPQEVFNKDMSNGNYSGLDFNIANFRGVNICGSDFTDCLMDFAIVDNAITDDNTILPNRKTKK